MTKPPGIKHDQGKPDLSMLPFDALGEVAQVMTFGAKKYGRGQWRGGLDSTRLASAALRHIGQWCDGVDIDEESGQSHLAHAATNLLFLIWMMKHKPELDGRNE